MSIHPDSTAVQWLHSARTLVLATACFAALVSSATLGQQRQAGSIAGKWQGNFPTDDQNGSASATNVPAVELQLQEQSGKLSGSAVFYIAEDDGNGLKVEGKDETPLIDPQFDGTLLKFSVRVQNPQPGQRATTNMKMKLLSDREADLSDADDTSGLVIRMKKLE